MVNIKFAEPSGSQGIKRALLLYKRRMHPLLGIKLKNEANDSRFKYSFCRFENSEVHLAFDSKQIKLHLHIIFSFSFRIINAANKKERKKIITSGKYRMKEIYFVSNGVCQKVLWHRQKRLPPHVRTNSRLTHMTFWNNNRKMRNARLK